jgi:hypothetical protein
VSVDARHGTTEPAGPGREPAPPGARHARPEARVAGRGALLAALRYLPAVTATAVVLAVLHRYGTPVPVALGYLVYLTLTAALPGTLVWRAVRGTRVSFVEDVAVGTAVGLAAQVLLAFALSPLHLSTWSWLWAPVVVVASLAVRRWRACAWSRPGPASTHPFSAWVQAGTVVAATVWLAATALAGNPVAYADGSGPWSRAIPASVYVDLPFHHAIAAGVDTYYPLVYPYLYDEPLHYHLFVYEHLAVAAHSAGLDLTWLLYRTEPVALVALGVVLVGALARRLTGVGWAAPLATAVVTASSSANVYGWTAFPFQNPGFLHFATYRSPTQTFGIALFLAALTAAVALLHGGRLRGSLPLLGAFTVLAWGAGGSKSTFLPVLVAGLALAVVVGLVLRSAATRVAAALLGISVAGFGLLLVLVLGGQSGSLAITPFTTIRAFAAAQLVADPASDRHTVLITALALLSWLCAAAGLVLLVRRAVLRDVTFWLLLGVAGAGIVACLLTTANGLSQLYFLYASWPLLGVLTTWGVVVAVRAWPRWALTLVPAGLLAGMAVLWAVRRVDGIAAPVVAPAPAFPYRAMAGPWVLLLAGAVVLALVVAGAALVRSRRGSAVRVAPVTAALVTFSLVLTGAAMLQRTTETIRAAGSVVREGPGPGEGYPVPRDGALAALHVRDHSSPDEVVATNAHCYGPPEACDTRHFWVSALTERRVLVEGWAYPEGFRPGQTRTSPFWDTERYAANQAVFQDPDEAAVAWLADEWGVRWLLVDRTLGVESPELRRYAELVHESDGAAVYRIG